MEWTILLQFCLTIVLPVWVVSLLGIIFWSFAKKIKTRQNIPTHSSWTVVSSLNQWVPVVSIALAWREVKEPLTILMEWFQFVALAMPLNATLQDASAVIWVIFNAVLFKFPIPSGSEALLIQFFLACFASIQIIAAAVLLYKVFSKKWIVDDPNLSTIAVHSSGDEKPDVILHLEAKDQSNNYVERLYLSMKERVDQSSPRTQFSLRMLGFVSTVLYFPAILGLMAPLYCTQGDECWSGVMLACLIVGFLLVLIIAPVGLISQAVLHVSVPAGSIRYRLSYLTAGILMKVIVTCIILLLNPLSDFLILKHSLITAVFLLMAIFTFQDGICNNVKVIYLRGFALTSASVTPILLLLLLLNVFSFLIFGIIYVSFHVVLGLVLVGLYSKGWKRPVIVESED